MPSLDTEMLNEIRLSRKALQDSTPTAEADLNLTTIFVSYAAGTRTYSGSGVIYDIRGYYYSVGMGSQNPLLSVDSNVIPWESFYTIQRDINTNVNNAYGYIRLYDYTFTTDIVISGATNQAMMIRLVT